MTTAVHTGRNALGRPDGISGTIANAIMLAGE